MANPQVTDMLGPLVLEKEMNYPKLKLCRNELGHAAAEGTG